MYRKFVFLVVLSFCFYISSYAQGQYFIEDFPIENIDSEYIEITPIQRIARTTCYLMVDFGQKSNSLSRNDTRVRDINKKDVEFNSRMDALNFMLNQGYELVETYITFDDLSVRYYYLLKKIQNQ